jgi:thiol-disulfide isomerase/thioredoxin
MWVYLALALFLGCISGCSATEDIAPVADKFALISREDLLNQYPAFSAEYQSYQASEKELNGLKNIEEKSVLVLFGTWCHDSEREVARLLKLLEQSPVEIKELKLVGVNFSKQDPEGLHREFDLRYRATIILLDGNKELGRMGRAVPSVYRRRSGAHTQLSYGV